MHMETLISKVKIKIKIKLKESRDLGKDVSSFLNAIKLKVTPSAERQLHGRRKKRKGYANMRTRVQTLSVYVKNLNVKPGSVAPALGRRGQVDLCEFKASFLVYKLSSRTA